MPRERRRPERAAEEATVARKEAGRAIDPMVRALLEPRLGHSLAEIRVHDDAGAHVLADAHDARAVTAGRHIALHAEASPLESPGGVALLAHEATHVVQQELATASAPPSDEAEEIASPRHELEAHRAASWAVARHGAELHTDASPATVTAWGRSPSWATMVRGRARY